jgi:hypothetical protein
MKLINNNNIDKIITNNKKKTILLIIYIYNISYSFLIFCFIYYNNDIVIGNISKLYIKQGINIIKPINMGNNTVQQ